MVGQGVMNVHACVCVSSRSTRGLLMSVEKLFQRHCSISPQAFIMLHCHVLFFLLPIHAWPKRSPFFPHTAADRELGKERREEARHPISVRHKSSPHSVHLEETSSQQEVSSFDSILSMLSAVGRSLLPSRQEPARSC